MHSQKQNPSKSSNQSNLGAYGIMCVLSSYCNYVVHGLLLWPVAYYGQIAVLAR